MNYTGLSRSWEKRAERLRKSAEKTYHEMAEQACLVEAQVLEVCADQLNRVIKED